MSKYCGRAVVFASLFVDVDISLGGFDSLHGHHVQGQDGKSQHQGRPGDWRCLGPWSFEKLLWNALLCPGCGEHNFASRSNCRKCNADKTEAAVINFELYALLCEFSSFRYVFDISGMQEMNSMQNRMQHVQGLRSAGGMVYYTCIH